MGIVTLVTAAQSTRLCAALGVLNALPVPVARLVRAFPARAVVILWVEGRVARAHQGAHVLRAVGVLHALVGVLTDGVRGLEWIERALVI